MAHIEETPWTLILRTVEYYHDETELADAMALSVRVGGPMMGTPRLEWDSGIVFATMTLPPYDQTPWGVAEAHVRYAPMREYKSSLRSGNLEIPVRKGHSLVDRQLAAFLAQRKVE